MRVDRLDHLVLTVVSIEATVAFYTQILGMDVVTFGSGRTALTFGTSKINLHQAGQGFEPKALLALIATDAPLLAAIAAVLVYWAWAARRKPGHRSLLKLCVPASRGLVWVPGSGQP